jgi:hypothetical protein
MIKVNFQFWVVIFVTLKINSQIAIGSYVQATDYERPNVSVLELQLNENEALLFGEVKKVEPKKLEGSNDLKGFQFFEVSMDLSQVWSKSTVTVKDKYKFIFGTMVDEKDIKSSTPVKLNEKIAVVVDSYAPNKTSMLKDHLLNIYEHHRELDSGKEYFISKLTKHYSQRHLMLSDLQRVAFTEKMKVYDIQMVKGGAKTIHRAIASEPSVTNNATEYATSEEQGKKVIKRQPNSSYSNKDEDLSVFGLLVVLISLAIFSHFVIKYYEDPEEEI